MLTRVLLGFFLLLSSKNNYFKHVDHIFIKKYLKNAFRVWVMMLNVTFNNISVIS
jgi:hypothetical protein